LSGGSEGENGAVVWGVLGDIAEWVAAGALLVVLVWAANERGQIHNRVALHRVKSHPQGDLL
jgi:hypothetical protein